MGTCDGMEKRTYDTSVWQHKFLPLCVAAWADNAIVKTLSNFHSSTVIDAGIKRRGMDEDGKRMKDPAPVNCPEQMVAYCETFHLIDKGNGVESRYTMANGGSKSHGWTPKLSFRLFNMTLNNAYKIYRTLHKRHHQSDPHVGRRLKPLTMDQAVEAVCWSFLQKGEAVRTRKATHPPPTRNLQFVMDINGGNKIRTDIEGTYDKPVTHNHHEVTAATTQQNSRHQGQRMNKKKKSYSWYNHQSECQEEKAECKFEDCPGRQREFYRIGGARRAPRPHDTKYKCIECSIANKKDMHFCNDIKKKETKVTRCHLLYHEKYYCTNTTCDDDTDDDTDDDN